MIILILGTLCTVSAFAIDMYLPAISQIAQDLSTTPAKVSMSISSYFIRLGAGQLFYGPMLDRFGRKRPLYAGLLLFIAASIGCLESKTVEVLLNSSASVPIVSLMTGTTLIGLAIFLAGRSRVEAVSA